MCALVSIPAFSYDKDMLFIEKDECFVRHNLKSETGYIWDIRSHQTNPVRGDFLQKNCGEKTKCTFELIINSPQEADNLTVGFFDVSFVHGTVVVSNIRRGDEPASYIRMLKAPNVLEIVEIPNKKK